MSRKKILFAWELGANYGHAVKMGQIAERLSDHCDVFIAARHPVSVRKMYPDLPAKLLQAPYQPTRALRETETMGESYPGILRQDGWDSADSLIPLIEAWRSLFDLIQPDILVSQAAPTALLAAKSITQGPPMKTVVLGSGYDAPPRTAPMQTFLRGNDAAEAKALDQESAALSFANAALAHFDAPPLAEFCDVLKTDLTALLSYPETDQYAWRAEVEPDHPPYLGNVFNTQSGQHVAWRNRGAPRILAYLRPQNRHFQNIISALGQIGPGNDIILAAPGLSDTLRAQLEQRAIIAVDGPVALGPLLPDCDLGISHAGIGTVAAFINGGVPQLCIPGHREQMLCAAAIANAGLGMGLAGKFGAEQVMQAVNTTLRSAKIKQATAQAKERIVEQGLDSPAEKAADLLLDLART